MPTDASALVRRYGHPTNRRSVLVEVTPAGGQACDAILPRLHALEAQWLADMAEPDRQTLVRLLGEAKGLLGRAQVPPAPAAQAPG